jgi:hypothetical protein
MIVNTLHNKKENNYRLEYTFFRRSNLVFRIKI